MEDILKSIIENKKNELQLQKSQIPYSLLEQCALKESPKRKSMRESLLMSSSGIIAEFKRRSPSKGWIQQQAQVEQIIPAYSSANAATISILTDNKFFGGTLTDLREASKLTDTPLLRKDFIIDEYQILQAKIAGASAILLIAAALKPQESARLAHFAKDVGLDTLLEIHSTNELEYIQSEIDMVGVNNRNLRTFNTDIETSFRLAEIIPDNFVKVAESGLSTAKEIKELRKCGFRGFLMGETLMRSENPHQALQNLIYEINK